MISIFRNQRSDDGVPILSLAVLFSRALSRIEHFPDSLPALVPYLRWLLQTQTNSVIGITLTVAFTFGFVFQMDHPG